MLKEDSAKMCLAIVGSPDLVLGFKALGFQVYPAGGKEEAEAGLKEAIQRGCAVCLIQEDLYRFSRESIESYKELAFPIVMPFSKELKNQPLEELIKDIRLRATGKF